MTVDKKSLNVEVEYPAPELTPEQVEDLRKRLENALVHIFPDFIKENDFTIVPMPRMKSH